MGRLFAFVEGPDDKRFFDSIYGERIIKTIPYATKKKEVINKYIESIKKTPDQDYIVVCDIDNKDIQGKKEELVKRFKACEKEKIIVTIAEIESWYLSGLDKNKSKAYKVKYYDDTTTVTKELFNKLIPVRYERINFMIEILKFFDQEEAMRRNTSYKYLVNYLENNGCLRL